MTTKTKIVRINAIPFRVPADELADPNNYRGEPCGALEPNADPYEATCTLAPHGPEVMHIAHNGEWSVIAMWGDPAEVTDADLDR